MQLGVTTAQVALAWLLRHSPCLLLIPGTSSLTHLRENLASDVRALVGREEQGDAGDFLWLPQSSQERPVEHLTCPAGGVAELLSRGAALDQAGRDRFDPHSGVLPSMAS